MTLLKRLLCNHWWSNIRNWYYEPTEEYRCIKCGKKKVATKGVIVHDSKMRIIKVK